MNILFFENRVNICILLEFFRFEFFIKVVLFWEWFIKLCLLFLRLSFMGLLFVIFLCLLNMVFISVFIFLGRFIFGFFLKVKFFLEEFVLVVLFIVEWFELICKFLEFGRILEFNGILMWFIVFLCEFMKNWDFIIIEGWGGRWWL